jgi:pyruvate dehydrogenase E2 component (dihydrolipoamide acetyltransferase)
MDVKLPRLAEGVDSGIVVNILVAEGQEIKKDQPIMELETQKAVGSIPSPESGIVTKIHVKEGVEVAVGQTLITVTPQASAAPAESDRKAAPAASAVAPPPANVAAEANRTRAPMAATDDYRYDSKSGAPPPAAPSIRKLARDLGIDLTRIPGSESGGRIVLADLRGYIQRLQTAAFPIDRRAPAAVTETAATRAPGETIDFSKWGPVRRERMSPLRRTVSRRMLESWTTVPKINQFDDADITALLALRKKYAPAYEKQDAHLTVTSLLLKVIGAALGKYPRANASVDEASSEIVFKDYIHIGVAVDTEAGLIVPILRDVNRKSLLQLSQELHQLTEKSRQRKIAIEELQGGTFTISNQGSIGGGHFTPIIYAPQVAILGVGQGQAKPVVIDNKIAIRTLLPLCLAYDHRVLDGGDAVRFLKEMIANLQAFPESLVKLT